MLEWSTYFQSPDYLKLYRKMIFDPDSAPLICKWMNIKDEMKILDIGCGTGFLDFFLSGQVKNCMFYGIDIDPVFIESAKEESLNNISSNKFVFVQGDALKLPFQNDCFDCVISCTSLTNIPNSPLLMEEMKRVVKPGGTISSITAQSFENSVHFEGEYSHKHFSYYYRLKDLSQKISNMYNAIQPIEEYTQYGTHPKKIPLLFANSGLKNIQMHSLGFSFSLCNETYSKEQKEELINLMYIAESKKFMAFWNLSESKKYITKEEATEYQNLIKEKRDVLLSTINEDKSWEWFGGAQLVMSGVK